jgi:hypothetical protein
MKCFVSSALGCAFFHRIVNPAVPHHPTGS